MQFVGSTGVTDTSLWTTSVFNNNIGEYIWLELYNGNWGKYSYNSGGNGYIYYRCVR
ncbi:hypothetical protein H3C61_04725, partial [Candidatus Gracilibacteria bacterium]|nr:hypothetical protein [Candidatus Gracilibacteria bacterium]